MQRKAERMKSLHEWTVLGVADAAAFPLLEAGGSVTELFGAAEGGPTGAGAKSPLSPRELCAASYSVRTAVVRATAARTAGGGKGSKQPARPREGEASLKIRRYGEGDESPSAKRSA